ncbi:MAG: hypothetical protein KDA85_08970 [Planctomycetaceae bacterium]|nr:hypothetical protein [Planctomycetaceae bacterium]
MDRATAADVTNPYSAASSGNTQVSVRYQLVAVITGLVTFASSVVTLACLIFGVLMALVGQSGTGLTSPAALREFVGGRAAFSLIGVAVVMVSAALSTHTTARVLRSFRLNAESEEKRRQLAGQLRELQQLRRADRDRGQAVTDESASR